MVIQTRTLTKLMSLVTRNTRSFAQTNFIFNELPELRVNLGTYDKIVEKAMTFTAKPIPAPYVPIPWETNVETTTFDHYPIEVISELLFTNSRNKKRYNAKAKRRRRTSGSHYIVARK